MRENDALTKEMKPLIDPFGRTIDYLRVSVTDRCDFRCFYCMADTMHFLPKREVLSFEELDRLCTVFVALGIRKLRVTGGEPLVRKDVMTLIASLSRHLQSGALDELTLTTNGSQLSKHARDLASLGIRRINLSLDTLRADRFAKITRWGRLDQILEGMESALAAGIKLKLNVVALKTVNDDEFDDMIRFCAERDMGLTFIETMPMGEIGADRADMYLSLTEVRERLQESWRLSPSSYRSGGPATYYTLEETGSRIGFISPLSHNFCEGCNRVRVTCTGTLYTCLGQEGSVDLRKALRTSRSDDALIDVIRSAIDRKPKGHDFVIDRNDNRPSIGRHMSVTGG
ncbi:GTP 3',8-cyclase MoaA [uncultured Cohaesibacter sp.]|uniref:GTP 3',8-cyclase MoaA n=1 Tax=uncultured Cohaesibacter sp. TaxID=1002546 RepID=UPI0029311D06|nr:GTP 3',8-cyclase MoaA [uncultured Cohaesibacter sp.]